MMTAPKAAIWVRVSGSTQETENQVLQLQAWAKQRGFAVVHVYRLEESAWKGAHLKALSQVFADARLGKFSVLLVWALDRLSREGPLATLEIVHRLGRYGVQVLSLQEPWTEAAGELRDLLLAIAGWVAKMESSRRSERTKAGLARARAQGKRLGRPVGSKDTKKRSRRGYYLRYTTSTLERRDGMVIF
jgi:DNA invertase Pin-like site-specific DNA recombinase